MSPAVQQAALQIEAQGATLFSDDVTHASEGLQSEQLIPHQLRGCWRANTDEETPWTDALVTPPLLGSSEWGYCNCAFSAEAKDAHAKGICRGTLHLQAESD